MIFVINFNILKYILNISKNESKDNSLKTYANLG